MQRIRYPISFPAYAYKVSVGLESTARALYGALDTDLNRLSPEFETLQELAEHVVAELLVLSDLPSTEEIPDTLGDLSDDEWRELNQAIELRAQQRGLAWTNR